MFPGKGSDTWNDQATLVKLLSPLNVGIMARLIFAATTMGFNDTANHLRTVVKNCNTRSPPYCLAGASSEVDEKGSNIFITESINEKSHYPADESAWLSGFMEDALAQQDQSCLPEGNRTPSAAYTYTLTPLSAFLPGSTFFSVEALLAWIQDRPESLVLAGLYDRFIAGCNTVDSASAFVPHIEDAINGKEWYSHRKKSPAITIRIERDCFPLLLALTFVQTTGFWQGVGFSMLHKVAVEYVWGSTGRPASTVYTEEMTTRMNALLNNCRLAMAALQSLDPKVCHNIDRPSTKIAEVMVAMLENHHHSSILDSAIYAERYVFTK
jgi:hypothetical protein